MKTVLFLAAGASLAMAAECSDDQAKEMAKCDVASMLTGDCTKIQEYLDCAAKAANGCTVPGTEKTFCESLDLDAAKKVCKDLTCTDTCFPATATVQVGANKTKQMGELQTGDKVHVGSDKFDDVYFFSTQLEATTSKFVKLTVAETESPLLITDSHFLYVNGELKKASSVQVGDKLTLGNGKQAAVLEVGSEWAPGLYNPHTLSGDIVVNGILTSTYTGAVHPTLAHALLLPLRQMYSVGASFGEGFSALAKGVPSWIRSAISA